MTNRKAPETQSRIGQLEAEIATLKVERDAALAKADRMSHRLAV